MLLFGSSVSWQIFCSLVIPVIERLALKLPVTRQCVLVSRFSHSYLMDFETLQLGAHSQDCYVFLVNCLFYYCIQKTSQSNRTRTTALSNSMKLSHAVWGHPRQADHGGEIWECGPLEKGLANHFSILALRTPWTVWKGKMIGYWKRNSPGQ